MCGIVGAISTRNVVPILLDGLRRLEYRGYDSAGLALVTKQGELARERETGKVIELEKSVEASGLAGAIGIAHTRWATHGKVTQANAHPHMCSGHVAVVHNGIIENFQRLREQQKKQGYQFTSETDTEVIVHQIYHYLDQDGDLLDAVARAVADLEGAYALGVISDRDPNRLIAARKSSPLIIGLGDGEYFIASDMAALIAVAKEYIVLESGDIAELSLEGVRVWDEQGNAVQRKINRSSLSADAVERGEYRHYMLKEINEQPRAIADTLTGRVAGDHLLRESFGEGALEIFDKVEALQVLACGTSFHAGLVAKYWMEAEAGLRCEVEVASEYRYRKHVIAPNTLVVCISQSGETADTLAALQEARRQGAKYALAICNVPESSLARESDLLLMTHAGPEIGVASTKAFTTQLVALMLLVVALGRSSGKMSESREHEIIGALLELPAEIEEVIKLEQPIKDIANQFVHKQHALFLGRGTHYPIAMEGALKLKEISYIHAESYPAGELKHGPLALVDDAMPVIAVAPDDALLDKLKSNLEEVKARGGKLIVFAAQGAGIKADENIQVIELDEVPESVSPIIYTVPLQLLSYYVAIIKGTDIDQPRNLAKSVTVE